MQKKSKLPIFIGCLLGYIFSIYLASLYYAQYLITEDYMEALTNFSNSFTNFQGLTNIELIPGNLIFLMGMAFLIVFLSMYSNAQLQDKMRPGKEKGSATWTTDLKTYNKKYNSPYGKPTVDDKNIILSDEVFLGMNGRQTMRNLNVLVTGGSGSGKSRFMVKPNLLQANSSFVVTDPKGELLKATGKFLEEQGYEVKVFNLKDMNNSCCYNPFNYIRNDEGVAMLINTLIKNTNKKGSSSGDPFWEKSETALLMAICYYLYYECPPEDRNFTNVMKLIRLAEVKDNDDYMSPLDIIFNDLKEKNPEHIAVRQYATFKMGAGDTLKSILISVAVRLTAFNMQAVERLTKIDTLDLTHIGDKKTALFCIIPDGDDSFNYLVAMMYAQLFESLYYHADNNCKGGRLPVHVRFLLDEFANIGEIPDFEKKLATMRSREISCTIIIQNMAQLKTMYKDCWESITGNCDSTVFLGGQEQTTLEYFSKKLGKETITVKNTSRSRGARNGSWSTSYNTDGKDLMTPDELGKMNNSNCLVFIRGLSPFFSKKYNYPRHKNYKFTEDADDKNAYICSDHFNLEKQYADHGEEISDELMTAEIETYYPDDDLPYIPETEHGEETFVEKPFTDIITEDIQSIEDLTEKYEIEELNDPDQELFNPSFDFDDPEL